MMAGIRKATTVVVLALALVASVFAVSASSATDPGNAGVIHPVADPVPGQYIVTLQGVARSLSSGHAGKADEPGKRKNSNHYIASFGHFDNTSFHRSSNPW